MTGHDGSDGTGQGGWNGGYFPVTPMGQTAEPSAGSGAAEEDSDVIKVLAYTKRLVVESDTERGRCPS